MALLAEKLTRVLVQEAGLRLIDGSPLRAARRRRRRTAREDPGPEQPLPARRDRRLRAGLQAGRRRPPGPGARRPRPDLRPEDPRPGRAHVARELHLSEVWNDYMFRHSSPVTSHLLQAESALVNAFNVHALTRAIDEFRPDVAYVWMIVGVGGLGLMATLQHLGVPWLWHLMDDVPRRPLPARRPAVGPLLREVDRQLDGRYLACSRQLVDEIEAGGVRLRPDVEVVPNWVVGEPPAPRTRFYRPGRDASGSWPPARSTGTRGPTT